ncbi:hypothetical protein SG34_007655 [Thalassomonas viridans]|uniref:Lipoprotein n=1 Tax=Thalassomonas viridans TaxID=137584 RepID=A0AAE9Z535_9GAMM|nr:DUF6279 family lipoprotein [Thalassomonas viridans]WDE06768.1 hypothetical protein SG34_007655 [Thalassomonas viridans]
MKKRLYAFLLLIPLVLGGCSTQFIYNNLDWLIHWYLDDYIELNKSQKKQFDTKMQLWLNWHKKSELARYQVQLEQIKNEINEPVTTPGQWLHHTQQARQHWFRFRDTLSPDLLELAMELDNKQIHEFFASLEQEIQEKLQEWQQERNGLDQQGLLKRRTEEIIEKIKPWTGKLTGEQKQIVAWYSPQYQSSFRLFLQYRRTWQARAKALLLDRQSPDFKKHFLQLLTEPERLRSPELKQLLAANHEIRAQLMSNLHATLTPRQQKRLNRKLDNLIADLRELQEE